MRWRTLAWASALTASLACGPREADAPRRDPGESVRRLLKERAELLRSRPLNAMSPETVSSLVPRLRVGMSHRELSDILAEKNRADPKTGAHIGTVVFGRGVVWKLDEQGRPARDERGEPRPDPSRWYTILHLRDADLKVILDREDRVLSWSRELFPDW